MYMRCFAVVLSCLVATVKCQLPSQEPYDYCDPKFNLCEVPADHTMCKYPIAGPSVHCTRGVHEPLSQIEKDRILYWHNKFRSNVANGTEKNKSRKLPTASNMRQLYWDGELETIAMRWVEQCTNMSTGAINDKCRNTKRFRVAQNVGTRRIEGSSFDKQAPQIVITWYKESKDFDPVNVEQFTAKDGKNLNAKQFANLIFGDSYAVGCARVVFHEKLATSHKANTWVERLVCNYGPGGLVIGKPIYKRGLPCSKCPLGNECSRVFPGLCTIPDLNKQDKPLLRDPSSEGSGGTEGGKEGGSDVGREGGKDEGVDGGKEDGTDGVTDSGKGGGDLGKTGGAGDDGKLRDSGKAGADSGNEGGDSGKGGASRRKLGDSGKVGGEDYGKEEGSSLDGNLRDEHERQLGNSYSGDLERGLSSSDKLPYSTARKKYQQVGLAVPSQRNDINIEKRKWIIPENKKVKRDKRYETGPRDGDTCHCFMSLKDRNGSSSCIYRKSFLLLFPAFIMAQTFLFPICHWM